jgi:hypothetical protein
MPLLQISPYITWKGLATNSAVPSFSRPDASAAGVTFKANPIKHWRKQLQPTTNSGASTRRAGIGMPMDLPGGTVYLGDKPTNTTCLAGALPGTTGLKEDIIKFNNTNFQYNDIDGCLRGSCNPELNRIKSATTLLSKTYYPDRQNYLRSRGKLYDQQLTALPVPGVTYLDSTGELIPVTGANAARQTDTACPLGQPSILQDKAVQTIYKPNNAQYGKQGAVDSSDRLTRLKLNTVNKNAASYAAVFGSSASRYLGMASTPYFLKSKYQACVQSAPCVQSLIVITFQNGPPNYGTQPIAWHKVDITVQATGQRIFTGYFTVNTATTVIQNFYYINNNQYVDILLPFNGNNNYNYSADNKFVNNNFTFKGTNIQPVISYMNTMFNNPSRLQFFFIDNQNTIAYKRTAANVSDWVNILPPFFTFTFTTIPSLVPG